jgi:acyl-CoA synthetase (AMP-forming)/AMP-acid ligase II
VSNESLWDLLLATEGGRGVVTYEHNRPREDSWEDLRSAAARAASGLRRAGVEPGGQVAMVLDNSFAAVSAVLGTWMCGAGVVSLPQPFRGQSEPAYAASLAAMLRVAGADTMAISVGIARRLGGDAGARLGLETLCFESLRGNPLRSWDLPRDGQVVFVQFSSGTTRDPRGCRLTAGAIAAQLTRLSAALAVDPDYDRGVSWLPLSHDMGFFGGLLLCWSAGIPTLLSTPERFIRSPRGWLEDCGQFRATITVASNSALSLATRAAARRGPSKPLTLRTMIVGAEEVQAATLRNATDTLAAHGLAPKALTPAYGLAEATLAVTVGDLASPAAVVDVDAAALAERKVERPSERESPTVSVVSVGRALRDVRVNVRGEALVGELVVRSPCLADGYVGGPECDADPFVDGAFHTSDIGFMMDQQLYVVGRSDAVIVVGGRNFDVGPLERAIGSHPAVRPGTAAAIAHHVSGRADVMVYVELRRTQLRDEALVSELAALARQVSELQVDEWVLLRRGRLPRTPSGKIARFRLRRTPPHDDDILARVESR